MKNNRSLYISLCGLIILLLTIGCGSSGKEETKEAEVVSVEDVRDSAKTDIVSVNGETFCLPSPAQTSMLIKQVGTEYNKEMLQSPQHISSLSTNFQKAFGLGVYGADLGYVTIYDQPQDAIAYLNVVKKLADDLGVSGAFDEAMMKRLESNIGNQDSLMVLVSDGYRACDRFLKENEREDIGVLVMAGGWVEALYFTLKVAKMKNNAAIKQRVGEQKATLNSLIKILNPYYGQEEHEILIEDLIELAYVFDGVKVEYSYVEPEIDADTRTAKIKSKSTITITDDQLQSISKQVEAIRNKVII